MSQLVFGTYSFPENRTWFTVTQRELKAQTSQNIGYQEVWDVGGTFQADSQAELTTAIQAFVAGTSANGRNLTFYTDAGSTESAHKIINANTMNGVRVVRRAYPKGLQGIWGSGTEYTKLRSFQVTFAAEVFAPVLETTVFHQSVRQLQFGGPDFEVVEALTGPPQVQQTAQQTKVVVEQRGFAAGATGYPTAPSPLWPQWLKPFPYELGASEPQLFGLVRNANFPIQWRYIFEAPPGLISVVAPPLGFS